jgi:hypothetical protein
MSNGNLEIENQRVLIAAKHWFEANVIQKHLDNTTKLSEPSEFHINPFTVWYLAKFIDGEVTPRSIAKALVYPRSLGTSISTSFGTQLQSFITNTLATAYGSASDGMDIDFIDQVDGERKFAQVKLGPNTINRDDVDTINGKFTKLRNLTKTNNVRLPNNHFAVGVMFGTEEELNNFYLSLRTTHGWELYVGQDFWKRLTGDPNFMTRLVEVCRQAINETADSAALARVVDSLAAHSAIQDLAKRYIESGTANLG